MTQRNHTITVFYHEKDDQDYYQILEPHLDFYCKKHHIALQTEANILTGSETDEQLQQFIQHSTIVLLLLSVDLETCPNYKRYVQQLQQRHNERKLLVVPIRTRTYAWTYSDWANYTALPKPNADGHEWLHDYFNGNQRDAVCTHIINEIHPIFTEFQKQQLHEQQSREARESESIEGDLFVLVVSSEQKELQVPNKAKKKMNDWKLTQYGDNIGDWKPFKNEKNIADLLAEYHAIARFPLNILPSNSYYDEYTTISDHKRRIVAIVDVFALEYSQNKQQMCDIANLFRAIHDIGGLLIPICEHADSEWYDLMLQARDKFCQPFLKSYYEKELNRTYSYIELNVPNKNELFRRLSNIAIDRLRLTSSKPSFQFVDKPELLELQKQFSQLQANTNTNIL